MKTYFKVLIPLLVILIGTASCKKEYLDRRPTNQAAMEDVFNTISGAKAAVNGIHRMMYEFGGDQHYEFGQPSINLMFDLMGEDLIPNRNGSHFNASYSFNAARGPDATGIYAFRFYYRMINNANIIIANIDDVPAEQADKDNVKAQALFYRAYAYYNLANMYMFTYAFGNMPTEFSGFYSGSIIGAPCVPLYTEPTQVGEARATVGEVYTQMNADLDAAIALFESSGIPRSDKSQIDIAVTRGLAARVALVQQNWPRAASMANTARQGYPYMVGTQLLSGFNDVNNSEWMWGSSINSEQATSYASFISFMDKDAQGYASIHSQIIIRNALLNDNIDTTDVRKLQFTTRDQASQPGYPYVQYEQRKFKVRTPGTWLADYPLMRAAEMALIEAEALAQQGNTGGAKTILEELIQTRDPEYTADASNTDALIKEIWLQRRIELWGEGFRFFDLKRQCAKFNGDYILGENEIGLHRSGNFNSGVAGGTTDLQPSSQFWLFRFLSDEILRNQGGVVQNP